MSTLLAGATARTTTGAADLVVDRTDIRFGNLDAQHVRIEITVRNTGTGASAPTTLTLESAAFGAFLPWSPLASLPVPSVPSGGSVVVATVARVPGTRAGHEPPPGLPRTAVGAGDADAGGESLYRQPVERALELLLSRRSTTAERARVLLARLRAPRPAPPMLAFMLAPDRDPRGVHWAGNLNVFVGGRAVERHMAQALRIHPGRTNCAQFVVGAPSRVRFTLEGSGSTWQASLRSVRGAAELPLDTWVDLGSPGCVWLQLEVPADATTGEVAVHVEREDTGETAVVEFSLDRHAAGPGCYTV